MSTSHKMLLEPCFVLHRHPYRETSAIVELFSFDHGRVAVVAKGIRSKRQNTQALLEPFCPVLASWQGRGELPSLTHIESNGQPVLLTGANLVSGFYLNEIILRLLHKWEPFPHLYQEYSFALTKLSQSTTTEIILRLFEKSLLENIGYGLLLDHDADTGEPINPNQHYHYIFEHGPVLVQHSIDSPLVLKGRSLLDFTQGNLTDVQTRHDIKMLMRQALKPLLGHQPLRSRELFKEMAATHKVSKID